MFGLGISREGDIVDIGSDLGIIEKTGTWYSYGEARIGQGRENAKDYLKAHPEITDELQKKIMAHYGPKKE